MTHENMDEFYKNILDGKNESDSTGIIKLIETGNEDFYLLCRRFVEFAINAKRFKVDDEPTIQALYEFTEVDKLARDVQEFLAKHNVCTGLELLKTIKKRYKEAITNKELNENAGFVPSKKSDMPFGYVGKFYDFTVITCWDEIEKDILNKISNDD